jgi:sulfatase maturation enzyme AslB (radical SAM superfamily)
MRGIDRLRENGIPFHVISVLTREALDHPDEL